ncbi:hypothetical protein DVH05_020193 [Phytophthora capsici]|nr:hypothetical protein DVH05_020193 [Phytophthora capsici]
MGAPPLAVAPPPAESSSVVEVLPPTSFPAPLAEAMPQAAGEAVIPSSTDDSVSLYEIQATASSRSQHIFDRILNANDDLTDGLAMRLYISIGLPIMIARKHPTLSKFKMLTNGTLGKVVGFSPAISDATTVSIETPEGTVHRLLQPSKLILIQIYGCNSILVPGFAPGVVGVPVLSGQVQLSKFPDLSQASITVKQFCWYPLLPAQLRNCRGKHAFLALYREGLTVIREETSTAGKLSTQRMV